jgi:hypothetical protein
MGKDFLRNISSRPKPDSPLFYVCVYPDHYVQVVNHAFIVSIQPPAAYASEHICSVIAKAELAPVVRQSVVTPETLPR